ncbi:MAG TPA: phosphate regulon sensor histidine kinase PhoR [Xanthomonadaceae bacterium]|nr:phosphate regulon sensor histidine kinase PhoR [Xanthomonadaceae bacterium]
MRGLKTTLFGLGLLLLAAWLIGFALDQTIPVLAIVLAGCLAWMLWQLVRLRSALGQPRLPAAGGGWGLWGDIHAELHRRQRMANAQRRRLLDGLHAFREAAAALPDGVVILDRHGAVLWFNKAAKRLLGLRYPKDMGGRFTDRVRSPHVARWLQADRFDEPLMDVPSSSDDSVRLGLRLIPCGSEQRMLVVRDISNLMRLEQVRRDFVANVSHELRTPLTVVHGYLDMIDPEEQPEWEAILRELRNQSRRMTQIVEDLLTLSRLEAQDSVPEEHVAMRPMLATLKREADALSQGRHSIEIEQHGELDLLGSTKDLHSAFSNLVGNAVRYTPAGGRIVIRWNSSADGGRFEVVDSGPGIPAQHIPRITERFYRVSTSRSRESGGTGLGLSIVKHVLNLHHGRLHIESEVGKGSTFACIFGRERLLAPESLVESE